MNQVSQTPRVDAALEYGPISDGFARKLERELNCAREKADARAEKAERALAQSQDRCAEVEKAVIGECEECGQIIITPLHHLPSVEKDAERYRFIRKIGHGTYLAAHFYGERLDEEIDAAIDAALKSR